MAREVAVGELYRIITPSGKAYIGITARTAAERFKDHQRAARRDTNRLLSRAIRKHGAGRMALQVLGHSDDWHELCRMEQDAIALFGTRAPHGLNATDGGEGVQGYEATPEVRARLGAATRRAWADPEYRRQQSEDFKARWADPDFRSMMCAKLAERARDEDYLARLRARQPTAGFSGRSHSKSTRQKMSKARKGNRNAAGLVHTDDARARIARKNANPSDETRAKKSAAAKARTATPEGRARMRAMSLIRNGLSTLDYETLVAELLNGAGHDRRD